MPPQEPLQQPPEMDTTPEQPAPAETLNETIYEFNRPWMYQKQMAAIFDPRRFSLIEASTKSGKTHGCLCWLIEQALLGGGIDDKGVQKNYSWIAPVSQQSEMAFTRMVAYLPQGTFMAVRSSPKRIILLNGAVIWFKSGDKPNSL